MELGQGFLPRIFQRESRNHKRIMMHTRCLLEYIPVSGWHCGRVTSWQNFMRHLPPQAGSFSTISKKKTVTMERLSLAEHIAVDMGMM